MSKLKGDLVNRAYQWLRISGLTSKATPEEISTALSVMEDMLIEFKSRNICSNYVFEEFPDPSTDSRLEPEFNNAVETNLALRMANFFGKEAPATLSRMATQSLSNWSARTARVNMINPPNRQPRGSGNTFRFSNWVRYYRFENNAPISCETLDLKVDEINSFGIDFRNYLNMGETISSFTLEESNGVEILSSSESLGIVTIECKGLLPGVQTVLITINTSDGRVNPELVYFNITLV